MHRTWARQLGPDHEHTLWAANHLARAYHDTRDYAAARELTQDLLARRRAVLGEDHPDTLTTAHKLAAWSHELGEE